MHGQILKTRLQLDPYVSNSLLRMYFELDEFGLACRVFDKMAQRDIISWNSMVTGCFKRGRVELALRVFEEMPEKDLVSCNSMVDGLMKWKRCDLARELFHDMAQKDVITWTTMVSGYVLNGRLEQALGVFREMLSSGVEPDAAAIVNVLSAVADLGFPEEGKWVHAYLRRSNIKLNSEVLGSALIDMYSKCGLVADAYSVFRRICDKRQVGDWNSMISGLSIHGLGHEALDIFREMLTMNIEPNEITFVGILNACSHAGLLKEGKYCFELMKEKFNIEPKLQHYGCMIDLLGRAGLVDEAMRFLEETMPMEPDAVAWKSVLSACVKYSYVKHGEYAATRAVNLAPQDSSSYVLLSNMYAKLGQWEDVERVRALMRKRCVHKVPGCSMVMINGKVHEFLVGNCSREIVLSKLDEIITRLKREGYEPDLAQVLVDVQEGEGEKERLLSVHSEKMAIAFGLMNVVDDGAPIHIVKNLRVCCDCHAFCELVSRVYRHEIVLRDQNRFHHFRGGSCSCNGYW